MGKELRAFQFDVRADQDEKHGCHLVGVPIVFGAETDIGYYREVIDRHALDNADMKDVRFLVNHNTDMIPLARSRNNNEHSTMQMRIEEDGLHIRVDLDTENNADARALYSSVKRGDVSGMSFMFAVERAIWEGLEADNPKRTIMAISKVFEVSAVTFPAYEQTSLEAKSHDKALDSAASVLDSAKADAREAHSEEARQRILRKAGVEEDEG